MVRVSASPASSRPPRSHDPRSHDPSAGNPVSEHPKLRVVIPVKAPGEAKLRLAGVLSAAQRAELVGAMLAHVVGAARAARGVEDIRLIGPHRYSLPDALPLLADPGGGLNATLASALAGALAEGVGRLLILPADLPQLTPRDIELLAATPAGEIAISPDRHGIGTNALSLPLPQAAGFAFAFGPDSFADHHTEAERLGLAIGEVHSPGLARDIDLPEDLPDAAGLAGGIT